MCKTVCCSISIWYLLFKFNEHPELYKASTYYLIFFFFYKIFVTFATIGISKVGQNLSSLMCNIHIVHVRKLLYHSNNFNTLIQFIRSYHHFICYPLFLLASNSSTIFMSWYVTPIVLSNYIFFAFSKTYFRYMEKSHIYLLLHIFLFASFVVIGNQSLIINQNLIQLNLC